MDGLCHERDFRNNGDGTFTDTEDDRGGDQDILMIACQDRLSLLRNDLVHIANTSWMEERRHAFSESSLDCLWIASSCPCSSF